ncbi:MAG: VCBS repeat-containing protein [Owenweeksia sp.]|nr:VCBS repeat-containing protein [Owenweeksia sp.]
MGDGVYTSDLDGNGFQDLLFIQPLKSTDNQVTLLLNKGNFNFERLSIPGLDSYLKRPKSFGVPSFAVLYDHDKDGDIDIFMGFGFGSSRLFDNQLGQDGKCHFVEKRYAGLKPNSICLSANAFDYNRDGYLDLFLANTLPPYLQDYEDSTRFNFFDLPDAEYPGDQRMFHFLHASWHNSSNGGHNWLLSYSPETGDLSNALKENPLPETRWTLGVGTGDFNNDRWTDLYSANPILVPMIPIEILKGDSVCRQGSSSGISDAIPIRE